MSTLTIKFGGTSVGSAEAIGLATDIVLEQAQKWERLAVVVSAMSGVTDALLQSAQAAASGDDEGYRATIADLRTRHLDVVDGLPRPEPAPSRTVGLSLSKPRRGVKGTPESGERAQLLEVVEDYMDDLTEFCQSIHKLREATPRAMDAIASLGERISARVVSSAFRQRGLRSEPVDATELIVTDAKFQNGAPLMEATCARISERLLPLLDDGVVTVVTGFIGATEEGVTTTLGRGGSDYSAAILGVCLDADEVWVWSDVDGVMTADPRLVPDARVIPILSYSEVSELAYFGAKVLHSKTTLPIVRRGIPLWVKNTFNPAFPGTRIVGESEDADGRVKAVTAIRGMSMVVVEGQGMMGVPGIAARTFSAVASQGASVLMIVQASSEQSICFVIPTPMVSPVIGAVEEEMARELARRDIDRVWSRDDVVIVTAVGAGLRSTPGVAASIFGALGQGRINVIAIAQGSSECSISLVVAGADAAGAVQQIHKEVILNG